MVAGGLRPLATERSERFNGKVGDAVARCRSGGRAEAFRKTPYVDWSHYWGAADETSWFPGSTGVGGHLSANGRGVDGALLDLEYQRMELIKFNLFDNSGTFTEFVQGRGGKPGAALKSWGAMRLPKESAHYAAGGGDGPQLCQGELIRFRNLDGTCNDLRNPGMGSTGMPFARNVQFESTYPDLGPNELARNRHGGRLSLLVPDPQVISRKLFTRAQSQPDKCRAGLGLPGA
ncbi:MAG: oxygenase, partial [Bacteriovorax sp.]|nr:oxygenase [Rhizobacter sp.]